MRKILFSLFTAFLVNTAFCQTVQLGKEGDNSSFSHIPVIVHKESDKMYAIRMSKINPQGFRILMENKKATLSALFLGYGRANSDESVMNLDYYYSKGNEYALEVYDNNMNMIKSYPLTLSSRNRECFPAPEVKPSFQKKLFT